MLRALRPLSGALLQSPLHAALQQAAPAAACQRWLSSSSSADSKGPPQQQAPDVPQQQQPKASTSRATQMQQAAQEEWTEVIDEKSGQPYYWNQKTGETTDLGEPRPRTRFREQQWEEAAAAGSGPFQDGWREPPGRDFTYVYSVLGVGIGVAAGWFTQYLH